MLKDQSTWKDDLAKTPHSYLNFWAWRQKNQHMMEKGGLSMVWLRPGITKVITGTHTRLGHPWHGTPAHTIHHICPQSSNRSSKCRVRGYAELWETPSRFIQLTCWNQSLKIIWRHIKVSCVAKKWEDAAVTSWKRGIRGSLWAHKVQNQQQLKKHISACLKQVCCRGAKAEVNYSSIKCSVTCCLQANTTRGTKSKGGSLLIQLFSSLLLGTSMTGADTVTYCHWNFIFYQLYVPCHICPGCNNCSFTG